MENATTEEIETINDVEEYIKQYQEFDNNSFVFRYPITKALHPVNKDIKRINLKNLKNRIDELEFFFDGAEGKLYEIRDFENDMIRYFQDTM